MRYSSILVQKVYEEKEAHGTAIAQPIKSSQKKYSNAQWGYSGILKFFTKSLGKGQNKIICKIFVDHVNRV
jgi:hypothetical protein